MIKNIIFDIGRVLLEFNPKEYLLRKYKDETLASELHSAIFTTDEWLELDKGSLTDEEAIEIFSRRHAGHKMQIEEIMKDWHNILIPIEGTVCLLKKLKINGYKIVLLSNFHLKAFEIVYNRYPFFRLADEMIISSRIKLLKPNREIYQHMLSTLSILPEESLFIDDTLVNIEGAKKLGINAVQFISSEQLEIELIKLNLL